MAIDVVLVTGLFHEKIGIIPSNVASWRAPPAQRQGHLTEAARCVIYTIDGKHVAVLETCDEVQKLLGVKP